MLERDGENETVEGAVQGCLANIAKYNDLLKTYITCMPDEALRDARSADAAAQRGRSLGLLHGMPVSVKDCVDVAGVRCTYGSIFYKDFVPKADAVAVQRLRSAGAIIVGKTNLHEFCFGSTTQNPHYGKAGNPWDPTRITSGSSGGAGASVAAEMCVGALGSDTGGSVRTPAAINGVSGLRPTVGAIPMRGSEIELSIRFDTFGPLARRVEDVARLFSVMAGYDPCDPTSVDHSWEDVLSDLDKGIEDMVVGLPSHYVWDLAEHDVAEAVRVAAAQLEALGAKLIDIELPGFEEAVARPMPMVLADTAQSQFDRLRDHPEMFGEDVLARYRLGLEVSGLEYAEAERWRRSWARVVTEAYRKVDVILTPTTPITAPTKEEAAAMLTTTLRMNSFTFPFTWTQGPGLSIPCGFSRKGLPIGMLLNGPWWSEARLFRLGAAYQRVTNWHTRRPPLLASAD